MSSRTATPSTNICSEFPSDRPNIPATIFPPWLAHPLIHPVTPAYPPCLLPQVAVPRRWVIGLNGNPVVVIVLRASTTQTRDEQVWVRDAPITRPRVLRHSTVRRPAACAFAQKLNKQITRNTARVLRYGHPSLRKRAHRIGGGQIGNLCYGWVSGNRAGWKPRGFT